MNDVFDAFLSEASRQLARYDQAWEQAVRTAVADQDRFGESILKLRECYRNGEDSLHIWIRLLNAGEDKHVRALIVSVLGLGLTEFAQRCQRRVEALEDVDE